MKFKQWAYRSVTAVALACLYLASAATAAPRGDGEFLVDVDWLTAHQRDDNLRIVDIRPAADYRAGHIPGAVNVEAALLFDKGKREGYVATLEEVRKVFSANGIDNERSIILYDEGSFFNAGRAFWIFELYGLTHVGILDGGIAAWHKRGQAMSQEPTRVPVSNYQPRVRSNRLATKFITTLAIQNPNVEIVDARPPEQYQGLESKADRAGHIPSAVNIPSNDSFVESDGVKLMKPRVELANFYSRLDRDKKVITYCNRGRDAAVAYFNLRRFGYDTSVFDGSWHEWANDPSLPIEIGK